MITTTNTPFQAGFLMGMEAAVTEDSILAPLWATRDSVKLSYFNKGVDAAYRLWSMLQRNQA